MYHILSVMLILIGLGVLLRLLRIFPEETASILNKFVLYVSFPCLVFYSLQPSTIHSSFWKIPPLAFSLIAIVFIFSYSFGKHRLKLTPESSASFAMGAAFGNTAFLGYPFVMALLGEKALPHAIFFDQMGNFLAVYSIGVTFCVYSKYQRFSISNFKEILKLPPFLAFVFALVFNGVSIPLVLMETIRRLSETTVPVIMVAIGLSLSFKYVSRRWTPILYASLIKMAILPTFFILLTQFLPFDSISKRVMVLQSATPTLMSSLALAYLYSLDTELCSSIIFLTTILSFISLPIWNLILQNF